MRLRIVSRFTLLAMLFCQSAYAYGPYTATLINTVDGDTFKADVALWPGLTERVLVRLAGVDTPELKASAACSKLMTSTECDSLVAQKACERALAVKARDYLDMLLRSGPITINAINNDKFAGRVDAVVTVGTVDASVALITSGNGRQYLGGPRLSWCL